MCPERTPFFSSSKTVDISGVAKDVANEGVVQAVAGHATPGSYAPYLYFGLMKVNSSQYPVRILRDTVSSVSLWVRPNLCDVSTTEFVLIRGVTGATTVPLLSCEVECDLFKGSARLGVVDCLPEEGDLLLGNDLVKGDDILTPVLTEVPLSVKEIREEMDQSFSVCAVTRAMSRAEGSHGGLRTRVNPCVTEPQSTPANPLKDFDPSDDGVCLTDTFMGSLDETPPTSLGEVDVEGFKKLQTDDAEVQKLSDTATIVRDLYTCFMFTIYVESNWVSVDPANNSRLCLSLCLVSPWFNYSTKFKVCFKLLLFSNEPALLRVGDLYVIHTHFLVYLEFWLL